MINKKVKNVLRQRISELRNQMVEAGLDGWIIGREDMFQGGEGPESEERLAFISGFTGSSGIAIIFSKTALLFSDGRYSLQMTDQVDPSIWECSTPAENNLNNWLSGIQFKADMLIGADGTLFNVKAFKKMELAIRKHGGATLKNHENLIDKIWENRPKKHSRLPWIMPSQIAGKTTRKKIKELETVVRSKSCDAVLLTRADSVNWLLNVRGSDLFHTPINLCFALLAPGSGLYVIECSEGLKELLPARIKQSTIKELGKLLNKLSIRNLMIETESLPYSIYLQIESYNISMSDYDCPVRAIKAKKSRPEIKGFKTAHHKDGLAMAEFLSWFEAVNKREFSESMIAAKLDYFRKVQPGYLASSFATIAGSGPNGAIVHYRAVPGADRYFQDNDLLLLDSGGHYREGTTDVTRTIVVGKPTKDMTEAYTTVLRAQINLVSTIFPTGTTGQQLDSLARMSLWRKRMDFAHGTGHGVGHVMSVHEGPVSISKRCCKALEPGMVLSVEPGYYRRGEWGIRIENLVVVKPCVSVDGGGESESFLEFETLTFCPYDRGLISVKQMKEEEIDWINSYHQKVYKKLQKDLSTKAREWLIRATRPMVKI